MLSLLTASDFIECLPEAVGKTRPFLVVGDADSGDVEAYVKLYGNCTLGKTALAIEAISALLAADLDLPVPEPFLVEISHDFADSIVDFEARSMALLSVGTNFGLRKVPAGFAIWTPSRKVPPKLIPVAAEIAAFDMLVGNFDRRPEKPNCLFNGDQFAIIDHEMAFPHQALHVIGWRDPWELGTFEDFRNPRRHHLFHPCLCEKALDFNRLQGSWAGLSDTRIVEYGRALPPSWGGLDAVSKILSYIAAVRDNLPACFDEIRKLFR